MHRSLIVTVFSLSLLACSATYAQKAGEHLMPGKPVTLSLAPEQARSFTIDMKADGYAEVNLTAEEGLEASFAFLDDAGKVLSFGNTFSTGSAVFIAPKAGKYTFVVKLDKTEDDKTGPRTFTLKYSDRFSLPKGSKQKGIRHINGYDVRIMFAPGDDEEFGDNVVLFEKNGVLKHILREGGNAGFMGFNFPDDAENAETAEQKKQIGLIQKTSDKTGDGIPDVMLSYYSGGAHCCSSTYFVNVGDKVEVVEVVNTDNAELTPIGADPKGGLRFVTNENAFAYWNMSFAGSPMPEVILDFDHGKLRPNFALMKKPAPTLAKLKAKARAASLKISNKPYTEMGMEFEEAFWEEMLDLIYTGHEDLAWQYFDMVWPVKKAGKEKFKADFKEALAESYYGTKEINTSNSMRNSMQLFEKIYNSMKEQ